jgi:hypothetical protein
MLMMGADGTADTMNMAADSVTADATSLPNAAVAGFPITVT